MPRPLRSAAALGRIATRIGVAPAVELHRYEASTRGVPRRLTTVYAANDRVARIDAAVALKVELLEVAIVSGRYSLTAEGA